MVFIDGAESTTLSDMGISLAKYGSRGGVLVTREDAMRARHDLEHLLAGSALGPGTPLELDFSEVIAISVPFADEMLGQLLAGRLSGYYEDHPVIATNLSSEVAETVDLALRHRRLQLLALTEGEARLLGADELLEQTLRAAFQAGQFRASQLAEQLALSPQAMNNRLKMLLRSGAVRRERTPTPRGGKEFSYEVPLPPGAKVRRPGEAPPNGGPHANEARSSRTKVGG
jgi:hypothetical protein